MCGIFCVLPYFDRNKNSNVFHNEHENLLRRRGPDAFNILHEDELIFAGFVLWQQGLQLCQQPVVFDNIILLFNGDLFDLNDRKAANISDSLFLAKELSKCDSDNIINVLRTLTGPYSMIIYNKVEKNLLFCRDSLGRNSFLIERDVDMNLIFCSTSFFNSSRKISHTMELPPLGLYKICTVNKKICTLFPWTTLNEASKSELSLLESTFDWSIDLKDTIAPEWLRLPNKIEMMDVNYCYDFYEMCKVPHSTVEDLFEYILKDASFLNVVNTFDNLLNTSVKERVQSTTQYCRSCIGNREELCHHSKVAILFSGGIDCSILAVLADKYINSSDSIDLINVAFEQLNCKTSWDVPDRRSAIGTYQELQTICSTRKWNFIEVNVTRDELSNYLQNHIKNLIYPLNTVMDESIGAAFWFASRGEGVDNCTSTARVVIIGSGADELFGGYTRHRNAYKRCKGDANAKESQLHAELELDWHRIPSRNLARDDRVIADNGKTSRAPFIQESLVHFVRKMAPSQRCCFLLDEGIGDKLFLRIYGYYLGLRSAVSLKKRAIQFGSRIANKKQNAKDKSNYLNFGLMS